MKEYFKIKPDNLERGEKRIVLISLLFFIIVGGLGIKYIIDKNRHLDQLRNGGNYKTVICEVTGYRLKFNKNVFDYYVGGKKYKHFYHNTEKLQIGEKYSGRVEPSDPNIIVVDLTSPIIDSINFRNTFCKILDLDYRLNKNSVKYEYFINEKRYRRIVYVSDASLFSKEDSYPIIYNKKDPRISYLVLPGIEID